MKTRFNKKRFLIYLIAGTLVIFVLVGFLQFNTFSFVSVCGDCGAYQHSSKRFGYTSHKVTTTPLSSWILERDLLPSHQHNWLFGHGAGNGISCAIGSGRHLIGVTDDKETIEYLQQIESNFGQKETRKWLLLFLDPEMTDLLSSIFLLEIEKKLDQDDFIARHRENIKMWKIIYPAKALL